MSSTDTFNVTAAITPANAKTGDLLTVTISGDDVETTTTAGTVSITLHLAADDGATRDLVVSGSYQDIVATHQSVKITGVTDPTGRVWTVVSGGLSATATA